MRVMLIFISGQKVLGSYEEMMSNVFGDNIPKYFMNTFGNVMYLDTKKSTGNNLIYREVKKCS